MIFDKYIALIIESIERHASLILTSTKEDNKILQAEIGALGKELKDREALHEKILELEQENRLLEDSVEGIQEEFVAVSEELEEVKKELTITNDRNASLNETLDRLTEELKAIKLTNSEIQTALVESEKSNKQLGARIVVLERKVKDTEVALENATQVNVEAQTKQERLLTLAKEYDKATVSMLNAVLERKPATEERKVWEAAKEALKGWDASVPKKRGRKKQS